MVPINLLITAVIIPLMNTARFCEEHK